MAILRPTHDMPVHLTGRPTNGAHHEKICGLDGSLHWLLLHREGLSVATSVSRPGDSSSYKRAHNTGDVVMLLSAAGPFPDVLSSEIAAQGLCTANARVGSSKRSLAPETDHEWQRSDA